MPARNAYTLTSEWADSSATACVQLVSVASTTAATWTEWSSNASLTCATSITIISATWDAWTANTITYTPYTPRPETAEQRAARAAQAELARQRAEVDRARRAVAIVKADKLLESILTDVQRAHIQAHGFFLVRGRSGQLYRIRRGWSGNVDVLSPAGEVLDRLCAHPSLNCPDGDNMAAQKLMLESADEALFLRIANKHGRPYQPERVPSEVLQAMAP